MRRTRMGQPMLGSGQSVRVIILGWLTWFSCAFTSPLFLWVARHFPIARQRWKQGLAVHIAVTTVVVVLTNVLWTVLATRWMSFPPSFDLQFFFFTRFITERQGHRSGTSSLRQPASNRKGTPQTFRSTLWIEDSLRAGEGCRLDRCRVQLYQTTCWW